MNDFKTDLKAANSLQDLFETVTKHYDTSAKLGIFAKATLVANIDKLISLSGSKKKQYGKNI